MPSPFSQGADKGALPDGVIQITESVLVCDKCFTEANEGLYYEKHKTLTFTCPIGHQNTIKDIEI